LACRENPELVQTALPLEFTAFRVSFHLVPQSTIPDGTEIPLLTATLIIPAPETEVVQILFPGRGIGLRSIRFFYMLYRQV
jgi:hypothetical protein